MGACPFRAPAPLLRFARLRHDHPTVAADGQRCHSNDGDVNRAGRVRFEHIADKHRVAGIDRFRLAVIAIDDDTALAGADETGRCCHGSALDVGGGAAQSRFHVLHHGVHGLVSVSVPEMRPAYICGEVRFFACPHS